MNLGNFSVSLAVKDLGASRAFYEKLGFTVSTGEPENHWLILRNGACTLGLFQGMFEKNIPKNWCSKVSSPRTTCSPSAERQ